MNIVVLSSEVITNALVGNVLLIVEVVVGVVLQSRTKLWLLGPPSVEAASSNEYWNSGDVLVFIDQFLVFVYIMCQKEGRLERYRSSKKTNK